jgi:predicted CXXCH cytochrome family protein
MKKILILVVLMAFAASAAFGAIAGSDHDLSALGASTMSSCQYCHTPHNALTSVDAPLWNKTLTTATFTYYGTTAAGSDPGDPGAASRICLTCHDGTLSMGDVITGSSTILTGANITAGKLSGGDNFVGTDLTDTHPVGVVYDSTLASGIAGLSSTVSTTTGQVNGKLWKIYGGGNGTGKVECGSCHDPHNQTAGQQPFLKSTLSTICSDCHTSK